MNAEASEAAMPAIAHIRVGEGPAPLVWVADMKDVEAFGDVLYPSPSGASGHATNPHLNEEYASRHIYGGLTVDGNQTVAFLCQLVEGWLPAGSLVSGHSEIDIKFPNPVRVGDTVRFTATVSDISRSGGRDFVHFEVLAENQAAKVVAVGKIAAHVPADAAIGQGGSGNGAR